MRKNLRCDTLPQSSTGEASRRRRISPQLENVKYMFQMIQVDHVSGCDFVTTEGNFVTNGN
jgi:hypothetical protein